MSPGVSSGQVFRFGLFEADVAGMTLTRKGVRVKIQDQPFQVLALLLQRAGEIVTREELRQKLWPEGIHVDFDGGLNVTLKRLRTAIDDSPDNPVFIETIPRYGYRFIAPVSLVGTASDGAPLAAERSPAKGHEPLSSPPVDALSAKKETPAFLRQLLLIALPVLLLIVLGAWRLNSRSTPSVTPRARVIAVLPFSNEGAGPEYDYLRYAIANDLVSDLVSTNSANVRPFASTKRYASQAIEPAAAGKQLGVTDVVSGSFFLQDQKLRVSLELVDVARNRSIWADELAISPEQLIALHEQLAMRVARGLLVTMNIRGASPDEMPKARNEEALNLFLHSLTIPLDPGPNQLAISKLDKAVSLDDQYGPAWEELGWRYYIDYSYGSGGEAALAKALQCIRRAQAFPNSTANSVTIRVEQGDLNGAYKEAATLLRKRPEQGSLHYEMSYVLRYAGLLDEAAEQCDAALALDPGYNLYRSCATPFIMKSDYERARRYIRLDENSGFGAKLRMLIALRTGNAAEALADANWVSQTGYRFADVARLYLSHAPEAELKKAADELEVDPRSARDPEVLYLDAAVLSFSKQGHAAIRELRKAIKGNHCSYPAMDKDPLFETVRLWPEFADLRQAGMQCQSRFLQIREQVDAEVQASN